MPTSTKPKPGYRPPADLHEAVERWIAARGRWCNVCSGRSPSYEGHDRNPACEAGAAEDVRQRFAETRPLPGESDEAAIERIVRTLFDDVSRTVEMQRSARDLPVMRWADLPQDAREVVVKTLSGVIAPLAQIARGGSE